MNNIDDINAISFEELMNPTKTFIALGAAYRYKETFMAWGWFWNEYDGCWMCKTESSKDDSPIRAISDLDGITVKELK